ncbi:MAG: M42 family peptidase [Clostridia bacterium]|nr:M42 family peptidase [Clostridia bacterium]
MKELLKQLCELDGVPGYEDEVRAFIEKEAAPYATSMEVDPVGNLIVFKKGAKPRKRPLLMMAHMDEVGFLVKDITEDGMLKLAPAGGIDPRVLIGRRMRVGEKKTPGIISLKAIHLTTPEERKEAPGIGSLYIDIGCTKKEQAEALVMRGDPAMFDSKFLEFGVDCVKAKAIDDRIGCAVMLQLLKQDLPYDTYFAFVVAEEIGSRGATVAAQRVAPGCVVAIEGTTAADMPDVAPHKQSCAQRKGAVVSLMDKGTVYNREFREQVLAQADAQGVKWQYRKSANGGTDARVGTTCGSAAIAFGLAAPVRYIHCACNVAYLPDLEEVRKLAEIVIKEAGELDV